MPLNRAEATPLNTALALAKQLSVTRGLLFQCEVKINTDIILQTQNNSIYEIDWIQCVNLTSNLGCDAAALRWADPRRWLVHTGDPRSRPRPPQTTQTQHGGLNDSKQTCHGYNRGEKSMLFTCSVLSNQRFPLLEYVPPPCRICAALRLAYLSVKRWNGQK